MPRLTSASCLLCLAFLLAGLVVAGPSAATLGFEQNQAPDETDEKKTEPRPRLPAYFADIVSGEQRDSIYSIQKSYAPQIDALEAELAALTKQRDTEIDQVLTPAQLKKVEALRAAAKAKREAEEKAAAEAEAKREAAPGGG